MHKLKMVNRSGNRDFTATSIRNHVKVNNVP